MKYVFMFLLTYVAMVFIASKMERHRSTLYSKPLNGVAEKCIYIAGWTLLSSAFAVCLMIWGASVGTIVWFAMLTFTSIVIGIQFTYKQKIVRPATLISSMALIPIGLWSFT